MKRTSIITAGLALLIGISTLQQPAQAGWTIYQRQVRLKKEAAQGMKANELTKKEYDGLLESLEDINTRIRKMKEKNAGKLSIKDQGKIERSLNDISVKITKLRLEKRVAK
jgi:5-bromo-4-chloroindolyl phosphate hydrolysis protein